jgi:hypothetical protein
MLIDQYSGLFCKTIKVDKTQNRNFFLHPTRQHYILTVEVDLLKWCWLLWLLWKLISLEIVAAVEDAHLEL